MFLYSLFFFSSSPWTVSVGLDLLCEVPRSHSDTPHSVGLLWTRDRPVEETFNWHSTSLIRNRQPHVRQDSNPLSQQASSRRPTPATGIGPFIPVFHSNVHGAVSNYHMHRFAFWGAFAKMRKANVCFFMSVCLSVRPSAWNNSSLTGRKFMKFDVWWYFENLSRKFKFLLNLTSITGTSL